ncbi:P-II family nitrogen regulator [Christensenellaceae bacterium OttesenSCG-928-K19]|nr:P-II family nitrogen regulator [Christensenellaceae bacterium OttesenSCG-928-K19]
MTGNRIRTNPDESQYRLILTIVNRGFADEVMDAARDAGAHGGTVLYARGSGVHEMQKFFGITIEPEKEVVLILVDVESRDQIMKAICKGAGLNTEGRGMSFTLPVDDVMGIVHLMKGADATEPP